LNAMLAGREVRAFEDRTVTPTYVPDAARATRALLERGAEPGLYHCVNSGQCTWLDFVQELARQLGLEPRIQAVRVDDVKLRAPRPRFCALSNAKLASAGIVMRTWQDALDRYLKAAESDLTHAPAPDSSRA
jgi:dTDP-4-dehydrorhamnose reductase